MGTTPVCTIDQFGIHRPTFATVLAWVEAQYRAIYGSDVSLDSSTQDGELVGLIASAIDDTNAMAVQAYNAFSPSTAQGVGLSSVVKINNIQRSIPTFSTAPMLIVGQAGTIITNGKVADEAGNVWNLPASVTIPSTGQIAVTATCVTLGAIMAPLGTINNIVNTQPGWQTASNTANATPGNPVELDPQLRIRQSKSTRNAATAIAEAIQGALLALPNVARARVYENDTDAVDANGLAGHSIAAVVDGGSSTAIAATIKAQKGGCGTTGTFNVNLTDQFGVLTRIAYFPVIEPDITVVISVNQLSTFTTDVLADIQNSVADWINNLGIGGGIQWTRLYAPAYLNGSAEGQTYEIVSIAAARGGATPIAADVLVRFNEAPLCLAANVTVKVLN